MINFDEFRGTGKETSVIYPTVRLKCMRKITKSLSHVNTWISFCDVWFRNLTEYISWHRKKLETIDRIDVFCISFREHVGGEMTLWICIFWISGATLLYKLTLIMIFVVFINLSWLIPGKYVRNSCDLLLLNPQVLIVSLNNPQNLYKMYCIFCNLHNYNLTLAISL